MTTPIRRNGPRVLVLCACRHWIDWRAARFVGVMHDDGLELRDCPACGSTRAIKITTGDEPEKKATEVTHV